MPEGGKMNIDKYFDAALKLALEFELANWGEISE